MSSAGKLIRSVNGLPSHARLSFRRRSPTLGMYLQAAASSNTAAGNKEGGWPLLRASRRSQACINPIRSLMEKHFLPAIEQSDKDIYRLGIGDPSIFGNLEPHPAVNEALKAVLDSGKVNINGYPHSAGLVEARTTIAEISSTENCQVTYEDVIMAPGTSGVLEMIFAALCDPGRSILIPRPHFTIYGCLAGALDIKLGSYKLLSERSWEVDLDDLERQIDDNTAAIIVNNPSNPCGSVYSRQHLLDILAVAEKKRVPIIADEVYAGMVFKGQEYHSIGALSERVPVISCGALSKRFLVPGLRCGWLVIYDKQGLFNDSVRPGLFQMAMRLLNPATIVQAAIPSIFKNVPQSFLSETMDVFENNAKTSYSIFSKVAGLKPVMPAGSMYIMVGVDMKSFPDFKDDVEFAKQLIMEQGVTCLPGSIFGYPDAFRIALIMPNDKLNIACSRISQFCADHYKP